jgi:ferric hydroxamate transport system substrate-binding protein
MLRISCTALTLATAGALLLSGCGTTEANPSDSAERAPQPVTVTDSRGTEVSLDQPATRVVGLEWAEVEMLATLGVSPVGVADHKGYATWNSAAPLDADVQDVGGRGEPSVDAIIALQPDLVVMEADRGSALIRQIEEYVPVIVTTGSDANRNLDRMRDDFTMVAEAVGATDEAEEILAALDATIAEGREQIAAAGATGETFAIADGWMEGSNVSIRMFGEGSLFSDLAEELGLENAWTGKVDSVWGLGTTDVEGMTALEDNPDLQLLYSASDEPDVFAEGLADNAIWESLPFVEKGNLTKLDKGTWTFGGPAASEDFIDQVLEVYTA